MYIFDTCSFITLEYNYPHYNFPTLWDQFEKIITAGKILSSEVILKEILNGKDIIKSWAKSHSDIFIPVTKELQDQTRVIVNQYPSILNYRKVKSGADPFIIAMAINYNGTLVTEETPSGSQIPKKIPDICSILGVKCHNVLNFIKKEKIQV